MGRWNVLGILLVGAGAGPLTTAVLHAPQISKLKELLKAAPTHTEEQGHKSDRRKSA
jgi:hypothetical protein